ncbi:hypothetical protein MKZ38_002690 [Zalerion maritima]|uniref:Uncharacterized protein n=1 Tax=Zalerion maritima TaxID=339359 RepID=A0AAD5WSA8_9PEZI|nr:hypothetical protein MKZ38_002690 [Zalerion maritima]
MASSEIVQHTDDVSPSLASAPTATSSSSGDEDNEHQEHLSAEISAYNALVADGGRPSHPLRLLKTVVQEPGSFRNILAFWQDRPDDYTSELEAYLGQRRGFEFPSSFRTASGGLGENPSRQGELAAWIEYLYYEYRKLEKYEDRMDKHEQQYSEAWETLISSGVLRPSEGRTEEAMICDPTSIQVASRMYERRRVEETINRETGPRAARGRWSRSPANRRHLADRDRRLARAKRKLELLEKRAECISIVRIRQAEERYNRSALSTEVAAKRLVHRLLLPSPAP